ncbi:DNA-directed RNA polymerase sigma-70 factor [Sphaerisporangium rufum]|uniref:DNA-directed RNA polymerase sigma-70 factor n=1 Tax=Sphaerisporangium rufum TaxID=1381558 RepID=A0A919V0V3_9ACTN|nr:RNA polymerase sigma factor [Sphaerisporangium rufum]GII80471.1 DNA-directed RNA polymerase sigma-70 factor [Sphaerisporangium rufum]
MSVPLQGPAPPIEITDADLIEQSWRHPERFGVLFDRYFAAVHRYVHMRLGEPAADDIAAETFLRAFRCRHRYDVGRPSARAWLYGITSNLVADHRRNEARRYRALARSAEPSDVADHGDRVIQRVSAAAMQPRLAAGLARLSAADRDVLLLVACAQLGYEEVADALGIPRGTVASRLSRARKKLRTIIGPYQEAL